MAIDNTIIVTIRFPKNFHEAISALAAKKGLCLSEIIRRATWELLDAETDEPRIQANPGSLKFARRND